MSQDAPPSRGLVAGKYELLRLIGRGGMGSVWEGRHTSLGTHVAIKFIEKEFADNDEARKRFDNEARAAAAIQSKHAIQIHDHGVTDDGKPYIVMELLIGEPLDKRLERLGVLPLRDTAHILQQVCRGLQKAHEHGIVHRDLKPENIFLVKNDDDDEEIAKVLDFGIAKIRTGGADAAISNNTRTGAVLGTPFYMSPEQARGLRDIDHRTDLWSLAVIAFKCVTGRLPFEGESLGDLLVKICTVAIPMPSQVNPQLPPSFDAWFSRALERDPNRRFGNALEFSEALAYAAGLSVRRPTPAYAGQAGPQGYPPASNYPAMGAPGYGPAPGTGTALGNVSPAPYAPYPTTSPYGQQQPMNVTSAPFVASAAPSGGGSKGLVVFVAFSILVGLGLGGWGVMRFMSTRAEASTPAVTTTTPHVEPPPTVTVTPLIAATAAVTAPTTTATSEPTVAATTHAHPVSTHHTITHVTHTTPTATSSPTVVYTVTPTATATHGSGGGDFGSGF